ncbi:MAG: hypothetical protein JXR25_13510 [Pontiellaceae bacterium]|nr:hypothetical protein [Pontiellaceae bacterium]MBN2785833.1 hypothetical protein [Pontiellaceae bacterium]
MSDEVKKRFFLNHKRSSAFVVSVLIHGAFALIALTFVAVKVIIKADPTFDAVEVNRPKMNLRKLQVPVKDQKKTQAPKLRQNLVAKPRLKNVTITMPDIVGVPGGMGAGPGGGLAGLGFAFDMDLFGSNRGSGNELIGTFYDLKQTPDGKPTKIGEFVKNDDRGGATTEICSVIKGFVGSGFNDNRFKDYFKAPKLKYATALMMHSIPADAAPKAFGVEDQVNPSYWVCHYKGQIAAPESGKYRFCGLGDDVLLVRVGRRLVLDACWVEWIKRTSNWISDSDEDRKFPLDTDGFKDVNYNDVRTQIEDAGGLDGSRQYYSIIGDLKVNGQKYEGGAGPLVSRMVIGDWFDLKKGQIVDIDILIGEIPGGAFGCRLMIEQEGKRYKPVVTDAGVFKILPAFMTAPVDPKLAEQMKINPRQVTLDGPVFGAKINSQR